MPTPSPYYDHNPDWTQRAAVGQTVWGSQSKRVYNEVLTLLRRFTPSPGLVVDAGCGAGAFGWVAVESGYEYLGLEASDVAVELGRLQYLHHAPSLRHQEANCRKVRELRSFPSQSERDDTSKIAADSRFNLLGADLAQPWQLKLSAVPVAVTSINVLHCLVETDHRRTFLRNLRQMCAQKTPVILTTMAGPAGPDWRPSKRPRHFVLAQDIKNELASVGLSQVLYEDLEPATTRANVPNLTIVVGLE